MVWLCKLGAHSAQCGAPTHSFLPIIPDWETFYELPYNGEKMHSLTHTHTQQQPCVDTYIRTYIPCASSVPNTFLGTKRHCLVLMPRNNLGFRPSVTSKPTSPSRPPYTMPAHTSLHFIPIPYVNPPVTPPILTSTLHHTTTPLCLSPTPPPTAPTPYPFTTAARGAAKHCAVQELTRLRL